MSKLRSLLAIMPIVLGACASGAPIATLSSTPLSAPTASTPLGGPTASAPTSAPTTTPIPSIPSIDPALPVADAVDPIGTCAGDSSLCTLMDVATWRSIPFTPEVLCMSIGAMCQVVANFYGPTHPGDWPLFVLVSGADMNERPDSADSAYIDDFARQLAGRGAVVMRANWRRNPAQGAGFPSSFADIACAIGVARKIGATYGADPSRVVLVGHSSGGWAATIVGLSAKPFVPSKGSCNETAGSLRPDAWSGMAPALDYASAAFLGGDIVAKPDAWKAVDAFALVAASTAADRLPGALIVGGLDELAVGTRKLAKALDEAGYASVLIEEPDADHFYILERAASIDALLALAARLD